MATAALEASAAGGTVRSVRPREWRGQAHQRVGKQGNHLGCVQIPRHHTPIATSDGLLDHLPEVREVLPAPILSDSQRRDLNGSHLQRPTNRSHSRSRSTSSIVQDRPVRTGSGFSSEYLDCEKYGENTGALDP